MTTDTTTNINRRQFLWLAMMPHWPLGPSRWPRHPAPSALNARPASQYATDGVYDRFVDQGVFLVRNGDSLVGLSSQCTHRRCTLATRPDHTFACSCHGSKFDANGKVTAGPAKRDLPILALSTSATGELLIRVTPAMITDRHRLEFGSHTGVNEARNFGSPTP